LGGGGAGRLATLEHEDAGDRHRAASAAAISTILPRPLLGRPISSSRISPTV
jgi:hypothetical protein